MFLHCKYLNARSECNDIVISVYSHYPLDPNAKSSDTICITLNIRWFCIRIKRVMTVYGNYDVIAFRPCIQILTVFLIGKYNYHPDARERDSACVSKNKRKALVGISIIAKTPLFMWDKCGSIIQSRLMIKHIWPKLRDVQVMLNT